jgi:hypothetical protein
MRLRRAIAVLPDGDAKNLEAGQLVSRLGW